MLVGREVLCSLDLEPAGRTMELYTGTGKSQGNGLVHGCSSGMELGRPEDAREKVTEKPGTGFSLFPSDDLSPATCTHHSPVHQTPRMGLLRKRRRVFTCLLLDKEPEDENCPGSWHIGY